MTSMFSDLVGYQTCIGYACDRGDGDRRIALFLVVTEKIERILFFHQCGILQQRGERDCGEWHQSYRSFPGCSGG